ncbi:MAG: hypothetical protein AB2L13_12445 [Spirochaetota bacterium]
MNNTLGQWGRDVAGMVSEFGERVSNWVENLFKQNGNDFHIFENNHSPNSYAGNYDLNAYTGLKMDTEMHADGRIITTAEQNDGSKSITEYDREGRIINQYNLVEKLDTTGALQYGSIDFLESYMFLNNGGRTVDLSKGFNIVMLENYFDDDPTLTEEWRQQGAYSVRGTDSINGKYFIVSDGQVVDEGYGTSHASTAQGHDQNAYRDLAPGDYVIAGENPYEQYKDGAQREQNYGRYMRVFDNEQQMTDYYAGKNRDTTVPAEYTGGRYEGQSTTQNSILLHWMTGQGSNWSGGLGCQLFDRINSWSKNNYSLDRWKTIRGNYYLIDRNRPTWNNN